MTGPVMLSPHFSVAEFEQSETADVHGIANIMPPPETAAARALCLQILEPIRAHFGAPLHISSGYRCPGLNRLIGSKASSQHVRGEAADIQMPHGPSNADLAAWISASTLDFDQLILEAYIRGQPRSGWVHISRASSRPQRRQILTMMMGSHGPSYTVGLHP